MSKNPTLTNSARTILRSRVRRHPDVANTMVLYNGKSVSDLSNADLIQVALLLGLDAPSANELGAYASARATNCAAIEAMAVADTVAISNRLGGAGMLLLATLKTNGPDNAETKAYAADHARDADADADADAAPAADTDADPVLVSAQASVKTILGRFGAGDMQGFNAELMALAVRAHKPAPRPLPVQVAAPDYSKLKGHVPKVVGSKTAAENKIKLSQIVNDGATALDVYDAPDAPTPDLGYIWPEHSASAFAALSQGGNVFLYGPAGTGKTTFAQQIAARYGRPFVRISCDDQTDAATLTGMTTPDGKGGTHFQDGQLAAAIRRPGTVILVDEPSIARPGALFVLQALLDDGRALNVAETGERIAAAPGVMFILADNTNGTGDENGSYEGTRRLNRAFLDRADVTIKLDYMPAAQEAQVIAARTGLKAPHAMALAKFAALTRVKANEGQVSHGVGIRRLFALARQITAGVHPDVAFQVSVIETANYDDKEPLRQFWTTQIPKGAFT